MHGVFTRAPELKCFFESYAPNRPQVFEGAPSLEESPRLLSILQQLKRRLENLENKSSANLTTNACVLHHSSGPTQVCSGRACVPPGVKSPYVPRT